MAFAGNEIELSSPRNLFGRDAATSPGFDFR